MCPSPNEPHIHFILTLVGAEDCSNRKSFLCQCCCYCYMYRITEISSGFIIHPPFAHCFIVAHLTNQCISTCLLRSLSFPWQWIRQLSVPCLVLFLFSSSFSRQVLCQHPVCAPAPNWLWEMLLALWHDHFTVSLSRNMSLHSWSAFSRYLHQLLKWFRLPFINICAWTRASKFPLGKNTLLSLWNKLGLKYKKGSCVLVTHTEGSCYAQFSCFTVLGLIHGFFFLLLVTSVTAYSAIFHSELLRPVLFV